MSGIHIIRRQVLEVELSGSESEGFALQQRLPELSRDVLWPELERVFDRLVPVDEHWLFDRLEIDAGTFQAQGLERDLVDAVTQSLERCLREKARPVGASSPAESANGHTRPPAPPNAVSSLETMERRSAAQTVRAAFVYFLRTGVLPWWFQLPRNRTLEDVMRESWQASERRDAPPEYFAHALVRVWGQTSARKRLVRQFSADFLRTLLAAVSRETAAIVQNVFAELRDPGIPAPVIEAFTEHLWESAFAIAVAGTSPQADVLIAEALYAMSVRPEPPDELLIGRIVRRWPAAKDGKSSARKNAKRPLSTDETEENGSAPDLEEGVYVGCAGVVLLHPFLPRLLEALDIAKDEKLLRPERALALLHFLSTGQRSAPEYELLLSKLLCNVPLDAPVQSRIELTAAEEDEAVALLAAVIRHWDALGETSLDGLRGSFLLRPGKLSRRGDDHVLQVETRSYDFLLDRLPWGIGTIQLPWMNQILWVEWRF